MASSRRPSRRSSSRSHRPAGPGDRSANNWNPPEKKKSRRPLFEAAGEIDHDGTGHDSGSRRRSHRAGDSDRRRSSGSQQRHHSTASSRERDGQQVSGNRRGGTGNGNNRSGRRAHSTAQSAAANPAVESSVDEIDTTGMTFADLGLDHRIVQVLNRQEITQPFPIQAAAIPEVLAGRDVLGRGPTGSGKTFTFGLPMIHLLSGASSRPGHPRALVLEPTRELAAQVAHRLAEPAAALGLKVLEVVGGVNIKRNITSLASPVDILVATPGRAQDLINQKIVSFDEVIITAVDEADQMADMGFLPQVRKLMDCTPKKGQRLLFSATLDGDVQVLVDRYMTNPVTHSTAPVCGSVDTMKHYRLLVGDKQSRFAVSEAIAAREGRTILFMRTKWAVDRQVKKLRRQGIHALGIHGDKGQSTREKALAGFTDGSSPVLVATDIAARGIDINDVSLVVHVDPPAEHKAYMHRAGRTARGGDSGTVVTLVMDEQIDDVRSLFNKTGIEAEEIRVSPDSPVLAKITGARKPSGIALPPPGGPRPARRGGSPRRGAAQGRARSLRQDNRRRR